MVAAHLAERTAIQLRRRLSLSLLIEAVAAAVLLATLLAYMLLGNFTRYVADDYSALVAVRVRGFWPQAFAEYRLWDGRFWSDFVITAGAMLNEAFVRVLPAILVAAWAGLLALALRQVIPAAGRLGAILLASGIVYTTLWVTPSPFLSLYFMTGSLQYVMPLIMSSLIVALICRSTSTPRRRVIVIVGAGLLAFLAAGADETYTVTQTVALTLAVALAASPLSLAWRRKLPVLAAAWAGSLAGFGLLLAAPGNARRDLIIQRIVGTRVSWLQLPRFTLHLMREFLQTLASAHWPSLLAVAVLAAFVGARSGAVRKPAGRSAAIAIAAASLGTGILIAAAIAPAAHEEYGANLATVPAAPGAGLPPVYAQIILVYICVVSIATLGWVAGRACRAAVDRKWPDEASTSRMRRPALIATLLIIGAAVVTGPIVTLRTMAADLPAVQRYANAKDAEALAATIAAARGNASVTVPALPAVDHLGIFSHPRVEDLTNDPTYWINSDEASVYGVVRMGTAP